MPYSGAGARWTSSEEVRRVVEAQTAAASGKRSWVAVLLGYAGRCRGKMAASLAASVASVAMGFVPFYAVYRIMEIVMGASGGEGGAGAWEAAVPWIAAAAAAYVASKVLFGVSTLLSHVSAYTILAQLRRDFAAKLMRASLGTVQGRSKTCSSTASRASSRRLRI